MHWLPCTGLAVAAALVAIAALTPAAAAAVQYATTTAAALALRTGAAPTLPARGRA